MKKLNADRWTGMSKLQAHEAIDAVKKSTVGDGGTSKSNSSPFLHPSPTPSTSKDQQIARMNALTNANNYCEQHEPELPPLTPDAIVEIAKRFEKYILGGE